MLHLLPTAALACGVLQTIDAAAVATEQAPTKIAFGSCVHQNMPQPIWDAVLAYRPELFVFAGDNVYGDVASNEMVELRAAYAKAANDLGQQRLRAAVPVLATWDDHDYGRDDGGDDFPYKHEAKALFLDHWGIAADDPRRSRDGIYHAVTLGPEGQRVQVILLDTRTFRSPLLPTDQRGAPGKERYLPDPDRAKTMLGEAQWTWLEARLRDPAELRLIVSSIQVVAEGHGWERWGNLPRERRRLFELIAETGASGVILLSGDRHSGALYRLAEGVPYPLHEITSSGLNMVWTENREPGPRRLGPVYSAENFGTIDVDWRRDEVLLALRDLTGRMVRHVTISFDALRSEA